MSLAAQLLFSVLFAFAASVNHIDDTDETYGYYEPIHYLLYGVGMQTWEYSPEYSIRSYAFLAPFAAVGVVLKSAGFTKLQIFYGIRLLLSQFMAFALTSVVHESNKYFGSQRCRYLIATLLCCPGLFFCSTALLPSAVGCALVALAVSSFMAYRHGYTIMYGCLAVLWSGWPFIGLIFLPLGLIILYREYHKSGLAGVASITAVGIFHLVVVSGAVLAIDSYYYGRRTFPPLNILLYNAISGNGDELYGIEPASYYVKNLLLTIGLSFPLALLEIGLFTLDVFYHTLASRENLDSSRMLTEFGVCMCAVLWAGVLFSRPHKEERFFYPIYPVLCFLSALALVRLENGVVFVVSLVVSKRTAGAGISGDKNSSSAKERSVFHVVRGGFLTASFVLLAGMTVSRVFALYNNYSGYLQVWQHLQDNVEGVSAPVNICMGSDWYTFPSHFFVPEPLRLQYISDGFGGVLPQHFAPQNGTSCEPLQPFNDQNREETCRYIDWSQCDYLVRTMKDDDRNNDKDKVYFDRSIFDPLFSAKIIDSAKSPILTRAFSIPEQILGSKNVYFSYNVFKVIRKY